MKEKQSEKYWYSKQLILPQCEFTWNYNPNHALTWSNPLVLYPLWIKSLGTNSLQCTTCLTNRRINHMYQLFHLLNKATKRTKIMRGKFCPLFTCMVTLLDPYFHTHHVLNLTSIYCKMCVSKTLKWSYFMLRSNYLLYKTIHLYHNKRTRFLIWAWECF